ncbi:mucin-15 [Conger conger]|uniref:mucin-15 n=1 Tax=Conger conger TaxID=82655 RepID=UPI002A59C0A3|nr:mucin-15 [Conger conger]
MDLCLSLTALLILMLQALNGVRLQEPSESLPIPPVHANWTNRADSSPSLSPDTRQEDMTNEDMAIQAASPLNPDSPDEEENENAGLPASPSPHDGTAGSPVTTPPPKTTVSAQSVPPGSLSTTPKNTGLPEVPNTNISSPLNSTAQSWPSRRPEPAPNTTGAAAPESHDDASSTAQQNPDRPPANSSSSTNTTTTTTTTTTTVTGATTTRVTSPTSTRVTSPTPTTTGLSTRVTAGDSGNGTDDRGFAGSNTEESSARNTTSAWGAIIGTALAVGFVGFIIYMILKKRSGRQFIHRKLEDDLPADPVLRLDNSDVLDLKFDGLAYYNPGLQGDHIQMTNFPHGHIH